MQCSDCSKEVLPIVAVDIDGTLSDYHDHFQRFAWDYWNLPLELLKFWRGDGDYGEDWGITKAQYREAKLAYRQGGGKRIQPIQPGAINFMQYLSTLPVEVWLTTTRPWQRHDSTDPDTRFWLDKHGIPFDHFLFDENKYDRLFDMVSHERVLVIVDDLPEQIVSASKWWSDGQAMLIKRRHNEAVGEMIRYTFGEIMSPVVQRLGGWDV